MMAHGAACRLRTRDPVLVDQLLTNYRRVDLEPKDRAMLDFAAKIAVAAERAIGEDLDDPRQAGWTDEDILHIIEIAAMFSYTGRLANAMGPIANPEYGLLGRPTANGSP